MWHEGSSNYEYYPIEAMVGVALTPPTYTKTWALPYEAYYYKSVLSKSYYKRVGRWMVKQCFKVCHRLWKVNNDTMITVCNPSSCTAIADVSLLSLSCDRYTWNQSLKAKGRYPGSTLWVTCKYLPLKEGYWMNIVKCCRTLSFLSLGHNSGDAFLHLSFRGTAVGF